MLGEEDWAIWSWPLKVGWICLSTIGYWSHYQELKCDGHTSCIWFKCPYVKVKWPVMTCSTSPWSQSCHHNYLQNHYLVIPQLFQFCQKIHPRHSTFSKHNFLVSSLSLNLSISTRTKFLTTSMPYYIIMTPIKQNVSRTVFTRTRFRTNWVIIILIEFTSKMY